MVQGRPGSGFSKDAYKAATTNAARRQMREATRARAAASTSAAASSAPATQPCVPGLLSLPLPVVAMPFTTPFQPSSFAAGCSPCQMACIMACPPYPPQLACAHACAATTMVVPHAPPVPATAPTAALATATAHPGIGDFEAPVPVLEGLVAGSTGGVHGVDAAVAHPPQAAAQQRPPPAVAAPPYQRQASEASEASSPALRKQPVMNLSELASHSASHSGQAKCLTSPCPSASGASTSGAAQSLLALRYQRRDERREREE
jgi:hypothetical protein